MIACVNVMIDNDDAYDCGHVNRRLQTRVFRDASCDIDGIEQAAIECVDIVDKHRHTK